MISVRHLLLAGIPIGDLTPAPGLGTCLENQRQPCGSDMHSVPGVGGSRQFEGFLYRISRQTHRRWVA